MATYYVYRGAGGSANGSNWANAYTTLTSAFSGHAAGDIYYVAHDHAESTAGAITLSTVGSISSPTQVICVNRSGSVPPVSADLRTTATVSTTGANDLNFGTGYAYWYGIIFQAGSGSSNASVVFNAASIGHDFKSCGFTLNTTSNSARFNLNNSAGTNMNILFDGCLFTFGSSTSQTFTHVGSVTAQAKFVNCTIAVGANVPTNLFSIPMPNLTLIGCDLSALGSGKTLVAATTLAGITVLQNCKFGASVTKAATPTSRIQKTYIIASDSADTNYIQELYLYQGTLTTETTIVRTGGASDGTTPIAWKIVTTANSKWYSPFECPPRQIWNDTTGSSKTVTIYGVWGGGAVPLNDEIWIEVQYLGTSGFPISSVATTTKADILATGGNTTSDSSTWGGSTTKFKMQATFTPQEKGPFIVTVKAAKTSSTFYIDPKIEVT